MRIASHPPVFHSEYLTALLRSIDESVVATDENFIIQYWNRRAEEIFGYTSAEAIGKRGYTILKFIYPAHSEEKARTDLLEKGYWKGNIHFLTNEGKLLLIDASVTVIKNPKGKTIGYVGVHRDITELNETKTELSTFLSIISSVDDIFFVINKDLQLVHIDEKANKKIKETYGFTYKSGDNVISKLPQHRKEQIRECFQTALSGQKCTYQLEIKVKNKNIWIQASYFPVKNSEGFITHACCLVRDITPQKSIEQLNELLYRSKKLFETFMDNSPILSWITGEDGTLNYINPSYAKTFKLKKTDIGKHLADVFPSHFAESYIEHDKLVRASTKILRTIEKGVTPDGQEHSYQIIKFPILSEGKFYVGGWAIDITEETLLKQSLTQSLRQLQLSEKHLKKSLEKEHQLNEMKSRFVSMASHEFRTPLSTILSSLYLLEKYMADIIDAHKNRHLSRIKEAVYHMNTLLDDFLSLGKLEEGKAVVHSTRFNIKDLITNITEELNPLLKKGQILRYVHEGLTVIEQDKKLLKTILLNLIVNAIKFSQENKKISITTFVEQKKVLIKIKDRGIGISRIDQKHLFESFYRATNAQNIQGTGLGLHIVKKYVNLLNGTIRIISKLDKGTTVIIGLPANN
ncbi:MAG TPA: PAS domain-containing sensor histidine kinase [Flavisolibacter sp.]|nr:PAS domain-containing sensor histidine kinase [Flavisolibacter sp.]